MIKISTNKGKIKTHISGKANEVFGEIAVIAKTLHDYLKENFGEDAVKIFEKNFDKYKDDPSVAEEK